MVHCWNSSSHASLSSIVFKIECQNSFVTLYGRQITYNNRIKCGPGGILNRSEPRTNMVYVSYDFYLINLVFIFIISHHSHMCPSPFFTEFSLPRHDRDRYRAFFNIAWSAQQISWISGHDMDWWALRLDSGWGKTISVSMLIDTLIMYSCWVIQGTNLSPCSSPTHVW